MRVTVSVAIVGMKSVFIKTIIDYNFINNLETFLLYICYLNFAILDSGDSLGLGW